MQVLIIILYVKNKSECVKGGETNKNWSSVELVECISLVFEDLLILFLKIYLNYFLHLTYYILRTSSTLVQAEPLFRKNIEITITDIQ